RSPQPDGATARSLAARREPRYHWPERSRRGILMAVRSSPRSWRAVIVGGSMSGLFTAAFLRRIGWRVDVFERSPVELVGRGAGRTTHPEPLPAPDADGA